MIIAIIYHVCFPGDDVNVGGPCPVAHYCPVGTWSPVACPPGSYNNLTGKANCTECPEQYYCPSQTDTFEQYPCPEGYFCPNGTRYAYEYPCPKGYFRNLTMGTQVDDCFPCPPGMFCGGEGLTYPSGLCDQGKLNLRTIAFNILIPV